MKSWENLDADVVKLLTKHYTSGRSGRSIDKVIVHYNAGNLTVEGCYSVWQTRKASAHYQVEDDGRIGQLVWDSNTAWHASNWDANCRSIGVEHANEPDGTITEECLDNGAHLVAAICRHFGLGRPEWLKNVFPHRYFAATSCPGQIYGSQKSAYIQRAQYWYDKMGGGNPEKPSFDGSSGSSESIDALARDVISGKYGNGDSRKKALGSRYEAVQKRVNEILGVSGSSSGSSSSSKSWKVGAKVRVTNPYDEHGTHLAVSGTYDIIQIDGDRVVIGRGGAVTAACPKSNLALA